MGFKVAVFSLNQWSLDFSGNRDRIIQSIDAAASSYCVYRAGPELEVCGYSLEDSFYESDIIEHCWQSLLKIIEHCKNIKMIVDIGMPVYNNALYNCRVIVYKGRILCIRAKTSLAREGIYREGRYFVPWSLSTGLVAYKLPSFVGAKLGQEFVPFGANFILELAQSNDSDTFRIGWEICQELWDPVNVSSSLYQNYACHLVLNGSASYWELRKLNTVMDMIKGVSLKGGACYAFSNLVGCDGQRYIFYGRSCIYDRGKLVAMTPTVNNLFYDVQMIKYTIFPEDIDQYRAQMGIKHTRPTESCRINLNDPSSCLFNIGESNSSIYLYLQTDLYRDDLAESNIIPEINIRFEQEMRQYVSLWLWDYLRRSGLRGFMMPLSGGLDSTSVATFVYSLSHSLHSNIRCPQIIDYFKRVHQISERDEIDSPEKICKLLLKCAYLSTKYSSSETLRRAKLLADSIGAEFIDLSLQKDYNNLRDTLNDEVTDQVSLLDQNLQARLRMAATYYLSGGNRIVLATGNVDEAIMGYFTKYDCSAADLNPIGGFCKNDLKDYLRFCCTNLFRTNQDLVRVLEDVIAAPPSAELTGSEQRDEDEIGLTYDEISVLGRVRRGIYGCNGPYGAFKTVWRNRFVRPFNENIRCLKDSKSVRENPTDAAIELGCIVKRFYDRYARNRHKLTVLTPALHAETYSPDDNRYDHRHFLYAPWTDQYKCIDDFINLI